MQDIHQQALRMAARLALGIGLAPLHAGGCTKVGDTEASAPDRGAPEPTETRLPDEAARREPETTAASNGTPVRGPIDCRAVIAGAFPVEGDYPGEKKNVSEAVQTCCAEMLMSRFESHRWDCCANLPEDFPDSRIGSTCTPWGPPVPPAMPQRRTVTGLA